MRKKNKRAKSTSRKCFATKKPKKIKWWYVRIGLVVIVAIGTIFGNTLTDIGVPTYGDKTVSDPAKLSDANTLYKDKLLTVTGTIASIGKEMFDDVFITISDGDQFSLSSANCTFKSETAITKVVGLAKDTSVSVIGKYVGAIVLATN